MTNLLVKKDISSNALKTIAIIAMVLDHSIAGFMKHETFLGTALRFPGRIVAPIMCFFIAEGYHYTSNKEKYILRLLTFSILSHFPYTLYFGIPWWKGTSVFLGLTLGLISLYIFKKNNLKIYWKIIAVLICCILSIPANWNYITVFWILCFGLLRNNFKYQMIGFSIIGLFIYVVPTIAKTHFSHLYTLAFLLAIPLLGAYKGRRGQQNKILKWGFYVIYPAHLLILYFLKLVIV